MLVDYNIVVDADKDRSAGVISFSALIETVRGQRSATVDCKGITALTIKKRKAVALTRVALVTADSLRTKE